MVRLLEVWRDEFGRNAGVTAAEPPGVISDQLGRGISLRF